MDIRMRLFITAAALLLAAGCAPQTAAILPPGPPPTIEPASPSPAPVISTVPSPTPDPTPTPTEEIGKVTLAEGFCYFELNGEIKQRITGISYPADDSEAKISYADLRYIKIRHYGFEGNVHDGELIVNAKLADEVMEIFYELYKARYPLTSVKLVDDFGEAGDDNLSMAANNTSAFNYRQVTGSKNLSRHSYGAAIDINPQLNPYVQGKRVAPENGREYADREREFIGKIDRSDLCYKLFTERGWEWGGDWKNEKDYQHFSKDLGFN